MSAASKKRIALAALLIAAAAGFYALRSKHSLGLMGAAVGGGSTHAVEVVEVDDVDHNWQSIGLSADALVNGAVFGQAVSLNGGDPGLIRLNGDQIRYHESDEGVHDNKETADLIALVGNPLNLGIDGEVGTINPAVTGQGMRVTINFTRSYSNPVLFVQVNSNVGSMPLSVYATNVQSTWAYVKFFEPSFHDGTHYAETIHWAVIDAGTYDLPDGRRLVVGKQSVVTADASDLDTLSLKGLFLGDAAVVLGIQHHNDHKYQGIRAQKIQGSDGILGIEARFMGEAGQDGASSMSGTIGYMALGTPFEMAAGRLKLVGSDGSTVGLQYAQHPNGHCYDLSEEGMDDLVTSLQYQGDGRVEVAVYNDAFCSGDSQMGTVTGAVGTMVLDATTTLKASSVRVLWNTAISLTAGGSDKCVAQGSILLQNDLGYLIFQTDGNLVYYRYNPADGTTWSVWESSTESLGTSANLRACFTTTGSLIVKMSPFNVTVATIANVSAAGGQLTLQADCNLVIYNLNGGAVWDTNTNGCASDMSASEPQGMPEFTIGYADLDGDEDEELILIMTMDDGSGYLMTDPMGIADFFYNTLEYGMADEFWTSLSATQQAILLAQLEPVADVGESVSQEEMETVLDSMEEGEPRTYAVMEYSGTLSEDGYASGQHTGAFTTSVKMGEYYFLVNDDAEHHLEFTAITMSAGAQGVIETQVAIGEVGSAAIVSGRSFAVGVQANACTVTWIVGDENGTYVGVSMSVGVGFWAEASWGKNGQFGFTLDLPIFPIGVAIYVNADDAMVAAEAGLVLLREQCPETLAACDMANTFVDYMIANYQDPMAIADDATFYVNNQVSNVTTGLRKVGNKTTLIATTGTQYTITVFVSSADAIEDAFAAVSAGINEGYDTVKDAISDWSASAGNIIVGSLSATTGVLEDATEATEEAVSDAVSEIKSVGKSVCKFLGC